MKAPLAFLSRLRRSQTPRTPVVPFALWCFEPSPAGSSQLSWKRRIPSPQDPPQPGSPAQAGAGLGWAGVRICSEEESGRRG